MTEEQKRFKIKKRVSYEEQISEENKKVIEKGVICGILAICAVLYLYRGFNEENYQTLKIITGGLYTAWDAYNLKDLIKAISRKMKLQGEIKNIDAELEKFEEMSEKEENRGMRKWRLTLKILWL